MGQFSKNYRTLPKKLSLSSQKYGFGIWDPEIRDPGSGKNLFRIQDPGVKKAPDPRSQIPELASKKRFLLFKSLTIETIHTPPLSSHLVLLRA